MQTRIKREEAMALLRKYNQEPFHIQHGLTLSHVMGIFAEELGFAEERHYWEMVGLLHDLDFEDYPEQHCRKAPELLAEIDAEAPFIRSVVSHAYGICSAVEPEHEMEKVLFAVDELTGLISAAILMRPSRSVEDFEIKSLKKKFKDKSFAAGCSRETIREGAERLGWDLDLLFQKTIDAMKLCEAKIKEEMENL